MNHATTVATGLELTLPVLHGMGIVRFTVIGRGHAETRVTIEGNGNQLGR